MLEDAREWIEKHPESTVSIQYNYPEKVCVIGTLSDAIKNKFVSANDSAMQMFNELGWLESNEKQPTTMMARVVMENIFNQKL